MTIQQLEELLKQLRLNPLVTNSTELFTLDSYDELFPLVLYDVEVKEVEGKVAIVMREEFT